MLLKNLKIAFRTLQKNKIYTFINIFGLAIGVAAVLLIFRMVQYELSFNKGFSQYDQTVRVISTREEVRSERDKSCCIPVPAMEIFESEVSQFKTTCRVRESWSSINVPDPNSEKPLKKLGIGDGETAFFTQSSFFEIFEHEWLAGDPKTVLNEPGTVVLTKSWAERGFGNWEDAMEQTVLIDNLVPCKVTGVVESAPVNTDFPSPYFISYETLRRNAELFFFNEDRWGSCSSNDQFFAVLEDPAQFDEANAILANVGEEEYNRGNNTGNRRVHALQSLSDLHYNEDFGSSGTHRTSRTRLWVLGFIGLLILVMACFNFINLTTAQAILRAKEVGVRKTLGSSRGSLIQQFMSETGLIVALALIIGVTIAGISSSLLKYISSVPDHIAFISNPLVWVFLLGLGILITVLAGLYPAFSLSAYRPSEALNDINSNSFGGRAFLRKSLIVLQFVIAQGLIIGAIITILQLDYIRSKDLGFNEEQVFTFVFNSDSTTQARQSALKNKLLQIPEVDAVSFSSDQPLSGNTWATNFSYDTRPEDEEFSLTTKFSDEDYQKTYGLELLAGRWFNKSDTLKDGVVNMTLLKMLGVDNPEDALNRNIRLGQSRLVQIVGVVKDFHTHSLHRDYLPLLMGTTKRYYSNAGIKIRAGSDLASVVRSIESTFDEVLPEQVFFSSFLDEDIVQMYEEDRRLSNTSKGFGFLAILISCLGLFGLATHATTQRVKEIGIRKVLGASLFSIVSLLSKDFLKLVAIALIAAGPLAWYLMNSWLSNFAYRVNIHWWVFVLTGMIAIAIAFLTVSFQSIRAALSNPIESLRDE